MAKTILQMYLTMLPLILSGIGNMIFTKTLIYKKHKKPIDGGRIWRDGKRIFGDNKTWIGFFSMIIISILVYVLMGLTTKMLNISYLSNLYDKLDNTVLYNTVLGLLSGFLYMIAELPNSFVKRRLDIESGKTEMGAKGICFFVIDQIDSLIGIALLFYIISDISIYKAFGYLVLGAFTHIAVNVILHKLKIRKNI